MNYEAPQSPREELEAKLTALLLGELPNEEAAALREIIEHDAGLARLYEKLSRTIALVRETAVTSEQQSAAPPASLKLSGERREKLLQHFKTVAPKEFERPSRNSVPWLAVAVAACLMAICGAMLLPALSKAKSRSQSRSLAYGSKPSLEYVEQERARQSEPPSLGLKEQTTRPAEPAPAPTKPVDHTIFLPSVGTLATAPVPPEDQATAPGAFPQPAQTPNSVKADGATQNFGLSGEPAWTGSLEKSELAHSDSNRFIGSYAYNVPSTPQQPGGLDAEHLRNFGRTLTPQEPAAATAIASAQSRQPDDVLLREKQARGYQLQPQSQTLSQQIIDPATGLPVPSADLGKDKAPAGSVVIAGITSVNGNRRALDSLKDTRSSELAVHNGRQTGAASGGIILPMSPPASGFAGGGGGGGGVGGAGINYFASNTESESLRKEFPLGLQTAQSQVAANDGLSVSPLQKDHVPTVTNGVNWGFDTGASSLDVAKLGESEKVPALGDLPLLGALSKSKFSDEDAKKETLNVVGYVNVPMGTNDLYVLTDSNDQQISGSRLREPLLRAPGSAADAASSDSLKLASKANKPSAVPSSSIVLPPTTASNAGTELAYYSAGPRSPAAGGEPPPLASPAQAPAAELAANSEPGQTSQAYLEAKRNLTDLVRFRQILDMKIAQEKIDFSVPKTTMVEIVDTAEPPPAHSPTFWEGVRRTVSGKVEAKARIKVERDQSDISGFSERTKADVYDPYFVQTEFEALQSDAVLGKVVKDLDLNAKWGKEKGAGQPLETKDSIKLLKKSLELRPMGKTSIMEIGVKSDNGEEAAKIANAVAESYVAHRMEQRKAFVQGGITSLEERWKEQEQKVQLAQAEVDRLRRDLNITDSSPGAEAPSPSLTTETLRRTEEMRAKPQDAPRPPKPAPTKPADEPQPEVQTHDQTFSTFSLNVSDVSFKLAGASLEKGVMPEPASVRSEEFINAFDYRDPEPPPGVQVAFAWERARYPYAQNRDLLRFSIKTAAEGRQPGCPLNIVLLLDASGSMERADRVRIIREALRVLAAQLQPQDKFSVVTFARTARLWVDGVPGNEAARVADEVGGITPQGGTNLEEAMNLAYQTALRHYLAGGVNRVVLLTDGAANLGNVEPDALKQKVEAHRKQGVALDCFGIGWEGYNDDLLEVLSRNGDGRYGFINTPEEAASGFAGQLAGALHVAASDVKVQVEFNPRRVTAWRQIGYAKHQLTKEQFRDNTVAAAQIGAAESGNALYVIAVNPLGEGPLGTVRVRYKVPATGEIHEHEWAVTYTGNATPLEEATPAMRLAVTASAFSEWLASSPFAADVSPDSLLGYLRGVPEICGADARPKKLEWMIRQAKSIEGK